MGLKKEAEPAKIIEHIQCDESGCGVNARCRVETEDGWKNYCLDHYVAHFTRMAKRHHADDVEAA